MNKNTKQILSKSENLHKNYLSALKSLKASDKPDLSSIYKTLINKTPKEIPSNCKINGQISSATSYKNNTNLRLVKLHSVPTVNNQNNLTSEQLTVNLPTNYYNKHLKDNLHHLSIRNTIDSVNSHIRKTYSYKKNSIRSAFGMLGTAVVGFVGHIFPIAPLEDLDIYGGVALSAIFLILLVLSFHESKLSRNNYNNKVTSIIEFSKMILSIDKNLSNYIKALKEG